MPFTPEELYSFQQLSTAGKDAEIAELHRELGSKDEEIKQLRATVESLKAVQKPESDDWMKKHRMKEGMRYIVQELVGYAERLPEKRVDEAVTLQTALLLLMSAKKIPDDVMTEELCERLNNIGTKEEQAKASQVYVSGGMAILGGNFDKTDFVAQKKIESK